MPTIQDLDPLVSQPREDLSAEYKDWLDLSTNDHKATLAKAAIALVNHGGGFIVLGFEEVAGRLQSHAKPDIIPETTQDMINAAIRRFSAPEFHCELYEVPHPTTAVVHPVILVPGTMTEPVMSRRDCQGIITQNRCYIRKPGPRSEEPQTGEEWRNLLNRCVRAGREDMLEAIRSIVSGRVQVEVTSPDTFEQLREFCADGRARWNQLTGDLPVDHSSRFPHGYYEMGFSLIGAESAGGLAELQVRLRHARRIRLTGWTPFLDMGTPEWAPYPHNDFIEAWVGRPTDARSERDAAHSDFWRASPIGKLYTIRGFAEDDLRNYQPGRVFDITLPIWRIAEGALFARRLAEAYEGVEAIAIYCQYVGIRDRALISVSNMRAVFGDDACRIDHISLEGQASLQQVDDNLVEVMHQLLSPLYEQFNFFRLPVVMVEEEIRSMTNGRF